MIPRNVCRHGILVLCLCFIALVPITPARTEKSLTPYANQQPMTKGYCASDLNEPVIYVSAFFDAYVTSKFSTQPLDSAFNDFLKAMYDYRTNSNYPTGCPLFQSLSQAEASKRQLETQGRQANKQIVYVDWNPGPGVEPLQQAQGLRAPRLPRYTLCLSQGNENTVYFSAVFDTTASPNGGPWTNAFTQFLAGQYSFKARVVCNTLGLADAQRVLKTRVDATRAASRKAVETDWKYDPNTAAITQPAPRPTPKDDDDAEPQITQKQQRPATHAPSVDIRDFATKEAPVALSHCQSDRMMSGAFQCSCVQRAVYDYRIKHATEAVPGAQPEPLVRLLAEDKLDCAECIVDNQVKKWAKGEAESRGLQPTQADCVADRFLTNLHAKPHPGRARQIFNNVVIVCKR